MSKNKKSILNELISGILGLLFLILLFVVLTLFSMARYGGTVVQQKNLLMFISILVPLIVVLIVCIVVKNKTDETIISTAKTIKAESKMDDAEKEKIEKFRRFYSLSEDVRLYRQGEIISTYPTHSTSHEQKIARFLVESKTFNPKCIFLDNYIKTKDGKYAQIDIIAVGRRGIFVIESKDYSGWIFGNGGQTQWTQTLYHRKYHFYNPIKQNISHINAIKSIVGQKPKFHSLIIFGSEATIKDVNYIPKDTYVLTTSRMYEVLADLRNEPECLSPEEVLQICRQIQNNRIIPDEKLRESHNDEIRDITGKSRLYS